MTQIRYCHHRNQSGKLFMTTCEIEVPLSKKGAAIALGVSICSERDVPAIREALNEVAAYKSMYTILGGCDV